MKTLQIPHHQLHEYQNNILPFEVHVPIYIEPLDTVKRGGPISIYVDAEIGKLAVEKKIIKYQFAYEEIQFRQSLRELAYNR